MQTVRICNYELDIYDAGPVGISVSGGADSALLLYIVMSHVKQHLHIYTVISPERREAMEVHVDRVVETCSRLTDNTNFTYHKDFVVDQRADIMFPTLEHNLNRDNIGLLYFGLTKFPPREVYEQFLDKQPSWHTEFRDDLKVQPLYGITIPIRNKDDLPHISADPATANKTELVLDKRVYKPFVNLNKKDIAAMYNELGIVDSVFVASRSCEDPTHLGTHCGKCWWCDERKWAFGFLE
jgi:hypothetical protein